MSPNVYARLDLAVQNKFSSKHSIALWEYLTDALGAKRSGADIFLAISDFRKLMSLDPSEYPEFSDLSKRVIKPAVAEINTHFKIAVTLDVRRKGRVPEALLFGVTRCVAGLSAREGQGVEPLECPTQQSQVQSALSDSSPDTRRDLLHGRLVETFKLKSAAADKVLSEYSLDYVCENLDVVERIVKKGTVRNVAAYTIGALKTDYRERTGRKGGDAAQDDCGRSSGLDSLGEAARIAMARAWYDKQMQDKQCRVRELFIAGLNVVQISPVRDHYHRHGFEHPEVMRAFMLHIAENLEKKRSGQVGAVGQSMP